MIDCGKYSLSWSNSIHTFLYDSTTALLVRSDIMESREDNDFGCFLGLSYNKSHGPNSADSHLANCVVYLGWYKVFYYILILVPGVNEFAAMGGLTPVSYCVFSNCLW